MHHARMSTPDKFPGQLRFVIVGKTIAITRQTLEASIRGRGGIIQQRVNGETDVLVVLGSCKNENIRRALDLRKSGHAMVIGREVDGDQMLSNPAAFFAALPDQIKQRRMAPAQDPESKPVAAEILVQAVPEQMGLLQWSALPLPRTKQLFEIAL